MRKHTDGGGWGCLWCGFHNVTASYTRSLSHMVKFKLLGVKVSLCVAKIPDYRLARYQALLETNWGKKSAKKRAQEQVVQDIN